MKSKHINVDRKSGPRKSSMLKAPEKIEASCGHPDSFFFFRSAVNRFDQSVTNQNFINRNWVQDDHHDHLGSRSVI